MRSSRLSLQAKFIITILLTTLPTLGVIIMWSGLSHSRQGMEQVRSQARTLAQQVILTRQWISDCGGIMVAHKSAGARNTTYFFNDRMMTNRGEFRRFTPAMVTKKLSEYSQRQDLYRFRLAALRPMNPKNAPSAFEQMAIVRFGTEGLTSMERIDSSPEGRFYQYVVPLYVDKTCLQCHAKDGFTTGTVGGGLSVFLPIESILSEMAHTKILLIGAGVGLILLTTISLFVMMRRVVIQPLSVLEMATSRVASGDLDARVPVGTGDEFDSLGEAFNTMAQKISDGRNVLERRIAQATAELSEANCELTTLDKMKSEFFADMSHELRSPITSIQGGVDYLKRTLPEDNSRRYIDIIDKNMHRLINLVSDMFDLTKIEAGKVEWQFEDTDLVDLTREVVEILSLKAAGNDISLAFTNGKSVIAPLDAERIEQVLVNLIENAIKFSHAGSTVTIRVSREPNTARVSVTDAGVGIAESDLENIFRKFYTLPSGGVGNRSKGTGLGLTICRKIVDAHGGCIWAESEEGVGSRFIFTIPIPDSREA